MRGYKPLVFASLLTCIPAGTALSAEICAIPERNKYEDLSSIQDDFKNRHAEYIPENKGKTLFDESELADYNSQSYFSPDEEPKGFSTLFSDVSEDLSRVGESISTTNFATSEILADNVLNSSLVTVGEEASELLGPVGDIIAVGLWGEAIVSTFENESATDFDKASAVLSIIPVVGDILGAIREPVDRAILNARKNRIQSSGYPYDRTKPELNDFDEDRKRWYRFASNYQQYFIPMLAKSVIEDVVIEQEHIYQTAVKAHDQALGHIFEKIDYEYFKSNQADIMEYSDDGLNRVHGSLAKACDSYASGSIAQINCLKDSVYIERLEELTEFVESQSYNDIAAINTKYASLRKRAVDQSLDNLNNLKQELKQQITTTANARWSKITTANWFKNIGSMLHENVYIPAFHEFADNQLNRTPSQAEVSAGILTVKEPSESCNFGKLLLHCSNVPGEYRHFNESADKRLKESVNFVNNLTSQSYLRQAMQNQLDNYLPDLLSGEALNARPGQLDKRPTWFTMVDLMVANYQELIDRPRQALDKFKSSVENIMRSNRGGLWSIPYLETQGFTTGEALSINGGNFDLNLVWRLKEFIDKEAGRSNQRHRLITSIQALYNQDFINSYNAYLQFVKFPFLSPFPTPTLLDQEAPELVALAKSLANDNSLSIRQKQKKVYEKIGEIYRANKFDHKAIQSKLGELARVQQFINVVDNTRTNNPNGLFFQDQLSAEYIAWSERSVINDARNAASDITSRLSTRNLSGLKARFDRLTITDSSICSIDPRNNEYVLRQVKNLGWDQFIYMPYMYQQIMEVFAYGDKVINLIKAKQQAQCP